MADQKLSTINRLRGLLEVTRVIRADEDLPELLGAVADAIAESLGYRTVAINLYRRAWDDFIVEIVRGNERAREALVGVARSHEEWAPMFDDRFLRRGAYFLPHEAVDWEDTSPSYVPDLPVSDDPGAWHPEDALIVIMRDADDSILGIVSVDEPVSGRRPTDEELDVLVAVADHAALAVQGAQEATRAGRHRGALEQLLAVSSRLAETSSIDVILPAVCRGIRDALGFATVSIELVDPHTGGLETRASVGRAAGGPPGASATTTADLEPLLDPRWEVEGCRLLTADEAARLLGAPRDRLTSPSNGHGPWAWHDHRLLVPLRDRRGAVIGVIRVDEPVDRLLPTRERLQALRTFANQATAAILSAEQFQELRFLADHDPLTRLLNRRAFIRRLDAEVARAQRYQRAFSLVVVDLDGFKALNDRYGHAAGDDALCTLAAILGGSLRRPDDAFRVGGDEFALLLAEAGEGDAHEVVARVTDALAACGDERLGGVRPSFGVASCPADAADGQTLFRLADEALYRAKRGGGGVAFAAA